MDYTSVEIFYSPIRYMVASSILNVIERDKVYTSGRLSLTSEKFRHFTRLLFVAIMANVLLGAAFI